MEQGRIIAGNGVGNERDRAVFAGRGCGVLAQKKPNLILHISVQGFFKRTSRARRPLKRRGKPLQDRLENVQVACLKGHGEEVMALDRSGFKIRYQWEKRLDSRQFSRPDRVT